MNNLEEIPKIFSENFPSNYINSVAYWGNFKESELHQKNEDGIQKLLHLDIDRGNTCSLCCPHCFRRDNNFDLNITENFLNDEEIIGYLKEAKALGLQSIKILGRGEPFEDSGFIGFLRKLKNLNIKTAIFTKGHVLGSNELIKKFNYQYGITDGNELALELKKLEVSILLGFNSFNNEMQNEFVGASHSKIHNYTELRNNALKLLIDNGFNDYISGQETKLAMIAAPIKPENINEIFSIYKWGRQRNIYVVSCPSNLSGKGINETERVNSIKDYIPNLINLYTKIYIWNIENKLQTLDDFIYSGVSLYPGCHPCNQTAAGMYLSLSGKVIRCPGRADMSSTFSEDIRKDGGIKNVWFNSENYKRAQGNGFNFHCPARDLANDENISSLPSNFYQKIFDNVLKHFS